MQTISKVWLFCVLLFVSSYANANLTIEITRGSDQALPIGIVPFAGGDNMPEDVAQIIQDNLERSGFFAPLERSAMFDRPSQADDVEFGTWRSLDVRYLVVGRAQQTGSGYQIQFELMDISGQRRMIGETVTASTNDLRGAAHYISDQIFEEITDIRGAFSTQIAYVTAQGLGDNMQFGLYVADADGRNSQQVLTSDQPIMSPAWSPDGRKLAYVSFETERPAIYIQDVSTGQRIQATSFDGINGAPTWSPDGRKIAMSLSKDGQPEIYILDINNRSVERITQNSSIDTEPAWAPDGRSLLFTSDRSGGPQIYEYSLGSGEANRITFTGNYNARARYSPDGEYIFLIHRSNRGYQVARQERDGGRLVVISETTRDESPSVAPNGTMVIFATQQGSNGVLSAVSADGRSSFRLPAAQGDVRDPAWSPFLN
ncbi:Tol-Pal system protein TolB [Halomonas sp. XH26]|uniref:Tol-Pal system protein TolB n=1 Tax=Vreelandella alkaliphila TaxID=272774 RepID=A0AAJ2VPK7_9GAMM|nr:MULTISPECIES: Tol-Pal system beta propeller repeat protein TolB [Halomonas]AIA76152.1 translocation protein TolB [Halomonas campaniensis]MCD6003350.1 Tol-Pal system beta propeller repeat protein TolB [Halomonas sp. IOP_6]MDX5976095.1 Tol-Pal system beta propeller repeat protein TolB [Halomonas alkaliphila]UTA81598.1 Tol-Pal system protein TolB [Halomonas sp. XH26]